MLKNQTPPGSNQDAFNRVWQHFVVEENPRCVNSQGLCVYRNQLGQGCAIGCMIPDKMAASLDKNDDYKTIGSVLNERQNTAVSTWFRQCSPNLLDNLQAWHDACLPSDKDKGYELICRIASNFGLTVPVREQGKESNEIND